MPVVIERPDGRPGPDGYSFFEVVDLVDAVIPERSEVSPVYSRGQFRRYDAWIGAKITFRDEVVARWHIRVDKHLDDRVSISDELRAAMKAAGLAGVATRRADPA